MRVLFYVGESKWSSCARAMLAVARGFTARGHEVTIACCAGSKLEALATHAAIDVGLIDPTGTAAGGMWDLQRIMQQRTPQVVIVATERDQMIVSSTRLFAKRAAVLRRVQPFARLNVQRLTKLSLRFTDAGLVFCTEREMNDAGAAGWSLPSAVAPLGVDASRYDDVVPAPRREMSVPDEGVLIACAYESSGRTRIATLFRTLAFLAPRHPDLHAVVFGPDSLDEQLRMHASALNVNSIVTFLGDVDDPLSVMRSANVGWSVGDGDAGAFACLDFMSLRMPVIADRSPLVQHYVADGITGLLLSPGEPAHTASSVAAFLAGEERRTAMGQAGRTRVQRDFTETAMIDGFERATTAAAERLGARKVPTA
ncbi:MAG TPA: glycosyltransferase family 4 protein [Gemmatimonadaceae bacterium]|jgi:glycosyltransferase involved in cell wall biosynthesis|nr:glycosyltransferase family 4 protein [Gemmatimonadaceae bacterium]